MMFPKTELSKHSIHSTMLPSETHANDNMPVVSSTTSHISKKSFSSSLDVNEYQPKKGDFRFVGDYIKNIQEQLSLVLKKMEAKEEWHDTFLIERSALLNQCVTTLKDNEIAVMRSQKGSKFFDKFFRLFDFILMEALHDPIQDETLFTANNVVSVLKNYLSLFSDTVMKTSLHMYGSHSSQALLACTATAMEYENKIAPTHHEQLSLTHWLSIIIGKIRDLNGFPELMRSDNGSHVLRTLILALDGFSVTQTSSFQIREISNGSLNKSVKHNAFHEFQPSEESIAVFRFLATILIDGVACDKIAYCTNFNSSAVFQLLFQLIALRSKEFNDLKSRCLSLFLPSSPSEVESSTSFLDSLINSASGSRIFDSLLAYCNEVQIYHLIWHYFSQRKPNNTLQQCAVSRYGNYVVQSLILSPSLKNPEFLWIIDNLDFSLLLQAKRHGIIWKCCLTCCRLDCHYKIVFHKYRMALLCTNLSQFSFLWFSLLMTKTIPEIQDLYEQETVSTDLKNKTFTVDPVGCSILTSFLSFPKETVQPLLQSAKSFTSDKFLFWLTIVGFSREGSYFFQNLYSSHSFINTKLKDRLTLTLLPKMQEFALHPTASFIVSSAFRYSSPVVQKRLLQTFNNKTIDLKKVNISLYRTLNLATFCKNEKLWEADNKKVSKVEQLFKNFGKSITQSQDTSKGVCKEKSTKPSNVDTNEMKGIISESGHKNKALKPSVVDTNEMEEVISKSGHKKKASEPFDVDTHETEEITNKSGHKKKALKSSVVVTNEMEEITSKSGHKKKALKLSEVDTTEKEQITSKSGHKKKALKPSVVDTNEMGGVIRKSGHKKKAPKPFDVDTHKTEDITNKNGHKKKTLKLSHVDKNKMKESIDTNVHKRKFEITLNENWGKKKKIDDY